MNIPDSDFCKNPDPCLDAGTCNPVNGCSYPKHDCGNNSYYCKNLTCLSFVGCSYIPIDCGLLNFSNTTCSTYNCSESQRSCVKVNLPCFQFFALAATISGGVIAVIIIVCVFVALGLAGTSAYAVSQAVQLEDHGRIVHNPLYEGKMKVKDVNLG